MCCSGSGGSSAVAGPRAGPARFRLSTGWCASSLRTVTLTIPPQEVITRDNVPVAGHRGRVLPGGRSGPRDRRQVEDFFAATSQIAQTTLRSVLGERRARRAAGASASGSTRSLQKVIDQQTEPWGVKVTTVEIKDVEIPRGDAAGDGPTGARPSASGAPRSSTPRASSRPPRSSPTPRTMISRNPTALQLRYLQTLLEMAAETELHHRLPAAARPGPAVPRARRRSRRRAAGRRRRQRSEHRLIVCADSH